MLEDHSLHVYTTGGRTDYFAKNPNALLFYYVLFYRKEWHQSRTSGDSFYFGVGVPLPTAQATGTKGGINGPTHPTLFQPHHQYIFPIY